MLAPEAMAVAHESQSESIGSGGTTDIILTPRASLPPVASVDEPAEGGAKAIVAPTASEEDGNQPLAEVLTEWAIEGAKVRPRGTEARALQPATPCFFWPHVRGANGALAALGTQSDSIITNPALGIAAVIDSITAGIDYVNEWREALQFETESTGEAPAQAAPVPEACTAAAAP